ncbi:MAG: hypothetical protein ACK5WZ_00540 [Pseudobdellovibrionaceae bacterium]
MISEKFQGDINSEAFHQRANYLGIAIQSELLNSPGENLHSSFVDLELFFLSATFHLKNSRITEGLLCWLKEFGHLLSPAKIRRLISSGEKYNSAILGGLIEFLIEQNIKRNQWKIIKPFCKKKTQVEQLLVGPVSRKPAPYFLKYRIFAPQFLLNVEKFLLPTATIFKNCIELRNRALFGSVVNADVATYLKKNPQSTAYEISKKTHHHKARVFEVYKDVSVANQIEFEKA